MFEVELKVRADHDAIRPGLAAVDADPLDEVSQVDSYYNHPCRDFADTDEALRLREESNDGESVRITYKGPLLEDESKTRREVETVVEDPEAMTGILTKLGFEEVASVRKTRDRFAVEGFTVSLDTVEGLGEFVEVETKATDEAAIERQRDRAAELLRRLDVNPTEHIRGSYLERLLDRGHYPG